VATLALPASLVAAWVLITPGTPPAAQPIAADAAKSPVPGGVALSDEVHKTAEARADRLSRDLDELRRLGIPDAFLADIEIYRKAARWALRYNEFYDKDDGERLLAVLDRGLLRASQQARGEAPWLQETSRAVIRGSRSLLDGSVQPYAVTWPADYGKDRHRKWRVDVVLHGRDTRLSEVRFLHRHRGAENAPREQDWVQLDIYGRGNNGYRWAGEVDVAEAMDNFLAIERHLNRDQLIDRARVVLRGFSMGGTGTYHMGLHRPDHWCVLGPGAGFGPARGSARGVPEKLPPYQEVCLHIYDAVDCAENAFDVPIVAYVGADDPSAAAARALQARLKTAGVPMTLLVAPGVGHRFPSEWQQKAQAEYARYLVQGRPEYPRDVRFETYTLKYPGTGWVEMLALDHHYQRARVDARQTDEGFTLKTANVRALHLTLPPGSSRQPVAVTIDAQKLEATPYLAAPDAVVLDLYLQRDEGRWATVLPERLLIQRLRTPQKVQGMQGPIDDALTAAFLCVRGHGQAWHEATQRHADACLERFAEEWSQFFRGELPVKDDTEVTAQDIATRHLILFGDPSSNSLIAQVLSGLPLSWTRQRLTMAGHEYDAADHLPALVYPSPLATGHYVVLNSGHTFHAADFRAGAALLYPRLGDWAVLKVSAHEKDPLAAEVAAAGLFDDFWRPARR
jgi:dienelactone hydrolase